MTRILPLFLTLFVLLSGCLALESGIQGGVQCNSNQVFDPLSRTCQGSVVSEGPPNPSLKGVNIDEDSGRNLVRLEYVDYENDLATACEVSSNGEGFVRDKIIDGVHFRTRPYDPYASNIALEYIDNGTLPTNIQSDDSGTDRIIQVFYRSQPPATAGDIIAAIQSDYKAAEWLTTSLAATITTPVSGPFSQDYFDELICNCTGGVCTLFLDAVDNWKGQSEFTYKLRDRDGLGPSQLVSVQVKQVNDPPVSIRGTISLDEDTSYSGNLISDQRLPINDASDIATPMQGVSFVSRTLIPFYVEIISAPALSIFLANNLLTIQIVPGTTTTDQLVTAINTSPILQSVLLAFNNAPATTLRPHPKTLLRQFVSTALGDSDPDGSTLTFELVTSPQYEAPNGTTLSTTGDLSYQPRPNYNSFLPGLVPDSLTYRVTDSLGLASRDETINIDVNPVNDIPLATSTTLTTPVINEDDINIPLTTLAWSHPDGDSGDSVENCTIVTPNNVIYAVSNCIATGASVVDGSIQGTLNVNVNLEPNLSGSQTFTYFVTDLDDPADSLPVTVTMNIVEQDDQPWGGFTAGGNVISLIESNTSIPDPPISFTLDSLPHPDAGVTQSYRLVNPPRNGVLNNCLGLNGSSNTDISCNYVPIDGNISGEGVRANTIVDTNLTLQAKGAGIFGNDIEVQMITAPGFSRTAPEPPALAWLEYDPTDAHPIVRIAFNPILTTYNDIRDALANSRYFAGNMIEAVGTLGTGVYGGTSTTYTLSGGADSADSFIYEVLENNDDGDVTTVVVPIEITPVNDAPVICEYTPFGPEQTTCGLNGCIGNSAPVNQISNPPNGLHYYDTNSGTCWASDTGSWHVVEGHIANKVFNELHPIVVDTIKINEGGGGTESNQTLELISITSSNAILFPSGNVRFFYDQNGDGDFDDAGEGLTPGSTFDNSLTEADARLFRVEIHPVFGQVGITEIEAVFEDDSGESTTVSFTITISPKAAHHGGWENVRALGPKINKFNQNRERFQNICPWSRSLCQTTSQNYTSCHGRGSPINNPDATPLNPDALYYSTGTQECYRLERTTIGDMDFISRSPTPATLELIPGGTAGNESVTVVNQDIIVTIEDGVSTSDNIISAIRADVLANNLVKAENRNAGVTQSAVAQTSLSPLSTLSWSPFQTSCHISPSSHDPACRNAGLGELCMGYGPPSFIPQSKNTSYYDMDNESCYRSIDTMATTDWQEYIGYGRVSLSWNQFNSLGEGSISGYNVYRRLAREFFNYHDPINKELIPVASIVTYEDNPENSFSPPLPGTVYYYEVRPVINGISTNTDESFKTLRVMVPPPNMAFVHRWIANQSICRLMNSTSIDATNNYRCPFEGPGDTGSPTTDNFYDIGEDLIVQRFESGCAYTSNCNTPDGECLGIDEPNGNIVAPNDAIYYSRSTGQCHVNTSTPPGGDTWQDITSAATPSLIGNLADAELPPLTFVEQEDAVNLCSQEKIDDFSVLGFNSSINGRIPNRKEQIAYSTWDYTGLTPSVISARERGLSLNSSSKCNTAEANGLADLFHDINSPDSNSLLTLPGTESSGIRSLMTGSHETGTELCSSRYGVQDHVGNVAEWLIERVRCNNFECQGVTRTSALAISLTTNDFVPGKANATPPDAWSRWDLDGTFGPCGETLGVCDNFLTPWEISDENFSATKFSIPMGLPIDSDSNPYTTTPVDLGFSEVVPYFAEVAPSNGITEDDLHNDTIDIQNERIEREVNRCGGFLAGGDYSQGNDAGQWHLSVVPCSDQGNKTPEVTWTTMSPKIGFRCLYRIPTAVPAGYEE